MKFLAGPEIGGGNFLSDTSAEDKARELRAQPPARGWTFCEALLDKAREYGVRRVVTFASLAAPMLPGSPSHVSVVATSPRVLESLGDVDVDPMSDGEIGGANGVLLAAAAARGLEGICLLGSFPYVAPSVPNPTAAAAVLRVFRRLAGLTLDTADLEARGNAVDGRLAKALQALEEQARARAASEHEAGEEGTEETAGTPEVSEDEASRAEEGLSAEDRERIERLFREATESREKALALKAELDRLGAYAKYEDRFLDLFKRAE